MNPGRGLTLALLMSAALVQGCATRQNPDPLEPFNRKVFAFNDTLDKAVLKPVATGYKAVTPQPIRTGISNFVGNLHDIWSAINLFLQGHPGEGAQQIMRVCVNTTLGLAGLIDMATPMNLERHSEDFGQTLGVWGVKPGAYIVWPLLGPSTARDSFSIPGDLYFSSRTVMRSVPAENTASVVELVNTRASILDATNLLGDVALDKYSFVRDAYLQRRRNQIYNGEPPDEGDDEEMAPPTAEPQSKAHLGTDQWPEITLAELQGLRADPLAR
ncbi:MAG: VacJ family lipoprotein [Burkholderiales bacterium]|nr:VacJ family lipoprotein [Burkholderiales bacterium]